MGRNRSLDLLEAALDFDPLLKSERPAQDLFVETSTETDEPS